MHQKYGKDGLVCISVCVDETERKEAVFKFLKEQKAIFNNYLLDEDAQVWQKKWGIKGPPAIFVFDREGKRAGKFDSDDPDKQYTYADVEKLVKQLLGKER
jgi:hypothetical protein